MESYDMISKHGETRRKFDQDFQFKTIQENYIYIRVDFPSGYSIYYH